MVLDRRAFITIRVNLEVSSGDLCVSLSLRAIEWTGEGASGRHIEEETEQDPCVERRSAEERSRRGLCICLTEQREAGMFVCVRGGRGGEGTAEPKSPRCNDGLGYG